MSISQDQLPRRASFPKGPRGETREQRRERYELWVLGTQAPLPDYEGQSIRFFRGKTSQVSVAPGQAETKTVAKAPSRKLAIASTCWQCEAGHDDANGQQRIADCARQRCGLHPVRPYREREAAPAGARKQAIRACCMECAGGSYTEIKLCHSVTCPLWPVRPGASADSADGSEGAGSEADQ